MFKRSNDRSNANVPARAPWAIGAVTPASAPADEPPEQPAPTSEQPDSCDEILPYVMLAMVAAE